MNDTKCATCGLLFFAIVLSLGGFGMWKALDFVYDIGYQKCKQEATHE